MLGEFQIWNSELFCVLFICIQVDSIYLIKLFKNYSLRFTRAVRKDEGTEGHQIF
jgi:hypothetical protein